MKSYIKYIIPGALLFILMILLTTGCSSLRLPPTQAQKNRWAQADKHYRQGLALTEKDDRKRAINEFNKAIKLNPRVSCYWFRRGYSYAAIHRNDEAIEDISRAIELNPEDQDYWFVRGRVLITHKEYSKAVQDMSKAIELCAATHKKNKDVVNCPNYEHAYIARALAYCLNGDYAKSIADYNKLLSIGKNGAYVFLGRGRAYHEMGKSAEARADYRKAIALDSSGTYGKEARKLLARLEKGKIPEPLL